MGSVRVMVNDTELVVSGQREIVGPPAILSDDAGKVRTFAIEFIVQGDTAAEVDSRFSDAFDDLATRNGRLRCWLDDDKALPTIDWWIGDGIHLETMSTVSMLPEESQTQRKLHCVLTFSALTELNQTPLAGPGGGAALTGQASRIEIAKSYLDSERYTLSCQGAFKSTLNAAAEGPYNLVSVSSNGGKARFTLQSPDAISAAFAEGMFIDVSSPSAYEGRHFITALSTGNTVIDTETAYDSAEGDVNATLLLGTTTTAEANFAAAKSTILVNLLETGTDGQPASTAPFMVKLSETIGISSEDSDILEFVLTSGPQSMKTTVARQSGALVERGLSYVVRFMAPDSWDSKFVTPAVGVAIEGKVAIDQVARTEQELHVWWDLMRPQIVAEVAQKAVARHGGTFLVRSHEVGIDYTTNDVTFSIYGLTNYNGTIAYSSTATYSDVKRRTEWEDTDGYEHAQETKGPPKRTCVMMVDWLGDQGASPPIPKPPAEGGFVWDFDSKTVTEHKQLEDEAGNYFDNIKYQVQYSRRRPRA